MKLLFIFTILLSSCSTFSTKKSYEDTKLIEASMDLARSAYLKGCVDALPRKGKGERYRPCMVKAKLYIKEIRPILKFED